MPFDATPEIKTNVVADTLRRAKALIDTPEKWCKGSYGFGRLDRCAYGAISWACLNDHRAFEFFRLGAGTRHIELWNDAPDRTHAEVLAAFDRAIALAERG